MKFPGKSLVSAAAGALLAGTVGVAGVQQTAVAEEHENDVEHCLRLTRIERTEVLDDRHILFYMHGDDIYLNRLATRCPGLESEDTFMYRTSLNQLCDLDILTVLHGDFGFGVTPGASCGLGMFDPVTEPEVEELEAQFDD